MSFYVMTHLDIKTMIEQQYIDLFQQYRRDIDINSVDVMNELRDAAFDIFKEMGFPTSKLEEYKHSDISRAFDANLGLNIKDIPIPVNPYDTFKCDVPNLATNLHFLVNDRYYENIHQVEGLPKGVFAGGMKDTHTLCWMVQALQYWKHHRWMLSQISFGKPAQPLVVSISTP